jgi:glycerol-3-phosphate O-acyltransferase
MSDYTAFERLTLPFVRWLVALWVRPSVLPDDVRTRLGAERRVVYALEKRSVVDLAVLEHVCSERGVQDPQRPFGADGLLPNSMLFLERRTGFFGQRIDRRMPRPCAH